MFSESGGRGGETTKQACYLFFQVHTSILWAVSFLTVAGWVAIPFSVG